MKYAIGIDLGGTNIKAVAVNERGQVITCETRKTNDDYDYEKFLREGRTTKPAWADAVRDVISQLQSHFGNDPQAIGLCAPGLASRDGRNIAFMPGRMAGLEGFDWTNFLKTPDKVHVLNDAQAALLGEVWQGAAAGYRDVIMLTLGTGVGGAIFSDGKLMRGNIGRAGHLGHMCLDIDGQPDALGIPGSMEDAIAERSVKRRTNQRYKSTKALVDAMCAGDDNARSIWERSVYQLACGLASLINALDPEIIVIGGGIAKAGDLLYEPLNKHLDKLEWRPNGYRVKLLSATLGEWAGAIGAAYNAFTEKSEPSDLAEFAPSAAPITVAV